MPSRWVVVKVFDLSIISSKERLDKNVIARNEAISCWQYGSFLGLPRFARNDEYEIN